MKFSDQGIGGVLKSNLDQILYDDLARFDLADSTTLLGFADFSGEHKTARYETFSFLFTGDKSLGKWLKWQNEFRSDGPAQMRRMAYKSLNDNRRKEALSGFLTAAGEIPGALFNVACPRGPISIFEESDKDEIDGPFSDWKPKTAEKVKKIVAFCAYFAAGLSSPNQNVTILVDNDSIAGNLRQHTAATNLLGSQILAHAEHNLGHFRLGTANSDNGSLQIEDAIAIADLAAGTFADLLSSMEFLKIDGKVAAFTNGEKRPSHKSKVIGSWLLDSKKRLTTINLLLLPIENGGFHAVFLSRELGMRIDF